MRSVGVPFGISVAVTRRNCDEVLSDEFLDFFFHKQKAFYCFFFQYLPIGRNSDLDNMPTPEQRVSFLHRSRDVIARQKLFLVDFWNHGPLVKGCIAAGREGGYLHIDWNGNVMPCVFAPYSAANVHDVFARGGNLNDIWKTPFLQAIRQWQKTYGYAQPQPSPEANWLRPCPFRDHHGLFRSWVDMYKPEPQDDAARESMLDDGYRESMVQYGLDLGSLVDEIWEAEYLGFRKPR